jgi:hypothetical protein
MLLMAAYLGVIFGAADIVRHGNLHGWHLYFWSLLPAIPVLAFIVQIGRYLHEETDEYQRVLTVRALLAGTGAQLGTLVVSDFLRSFARVGALPPFVLFVIFFAVLGIAQVAQSMRDRAARDE